MYECELDYEGDMSYYQEQLTEKGITKEMLDMSRYIGLTASELQSIVDCAGRKVEEKKNNVKREKERIC